MDFILLSLCFYGEFMLSLMKCNHKVINGYLANNEVLDDSFNVLR